MLDWPDAHPTTRCLVRMAHWCSWHTWCICFVWSWCWTARHSLWWRHTVEAGVASEACKQTPLAGQGYRCRTNIGTRQLNTSPGCTSNTCIKHLRSLSLFTSMQVWLNDASSNNMLSSQNGTLVKLTNIGAFEAAIELQDTVCDDTLGKLLWLQKRVNNTPYWAKLQVHEHYWHNSYVSGSRSSRHMIWTSPG